MFQHNLGGRHECVSSSLPPGRGFRSTGVLPYVRSVKCLPLCFYTEGPGPRGRLHESADGGTVVTQAAGLQSAALWWYLRALSYRNGM